MRRTFLIGLAAVAALVVAVVVAADERDESIEPAPRSAAAARPAGLEAHLRALQRIADRNGGNRAAGSRGYDESAAYVAGRLERAGYRVSRQTVRFPFFEERSRPRVQAGGRRLRDRRDLRALIYSGSGSVSARARLVESDGCSRSDFGELRDGEIALVPRGPCFLRRKADLAERAGAAAVLIVNQDDETIPGTLGSPGVGIPALVLSRSAGRGLDGRRLEVRTDTVSEQRRTTNVIADPPGAAGRVVMAGAHLDSVDDGPGLNDNGSGVAALLDSAERMAGSDSRVRFAFWAAEELGLYGSRRYVRGLDRAERRQIRAYLNFDMVGSPNGVRAVYDTDDFVERALRRAYRGERRLDEEDLGRASDHAPFADAGIPVGGLYTGSTEVKTAALARAQGGRAGRRLDPCYHRACDTLRNVDTDVLEEMARTAERALRRLSPR